jgi:hypothetical protein
MALCWKDGVIEAVLGKKVADVLGVLLASKLSFQQLQTVTDAIVGQPPRGLEVPAPNPAQAAKLRHIENAARVRKALEEKEANARVRDACT